MKKLLLLSTVAALAIGSSAQAANLISAAVTGPTGTIWDTTSNSFYTLFLQQPGLGNFLNPNDQAINAAVTTGNNRFLLAGDGFPRGTITDSDPIFNLTLRFADGASLTGRYTPLTNTFAGGTSATVGRTTYTLNEFSFRRNLGDSVSEFVARPGGDGNDYSGNFRFTAALAAVPEPASWAMLITGFGLVGGAMRRRSTRTVVFA